LSLLVIDEMRLLCH